MLAPVPDPALRHDRLVAADHMAAPTFEAWRRLAGYEPYNRFHHLIPRQA